ncbi:MAG: phage integrase SAM-like domain-containing protein, partial [Bacteroidota bacterium]
MSVNPQHLSLYKRSNGVYYIGYYQEGRRKWKTTGYTAKPEALKALTSFKELIQDRLRSVSFEEFALRFLSFAESNLAHKSVQLYKTVFKSFTSFLRGHYLKEITPELIDRYKSKRLKEVSPVSVNIELRMLRAAFST